MKKKSSKKQILEKKSKSIQRSSKTELDQADLFDEPEGLDEDRELGDFPIDTLLIRNETRSVFEIIRRIEAGGYVMNLSLIHI